MNLLARARTQDLGAIFGNFGEIKSASLVTDNNGDSKGYGFVKVCIPTKPTRVGLGGCACSPPLPSRTVHCRIYRHFATLAVSISLSARRLVYGARRVFVEEASGQAEQKRLVACRVLGLVSPLRIKIVVTKIINLLVHAYTRVERYG